MFTVDARCDRCEKKATCLERPIVVKTLMALANDLNAPKYDESPGDGLLIFHCSGYVPG